MGFPKQKYWSGLPFPSPGDLSHLGIKSVSLALAGRFFATDLPGKPLFSWAPKSLWMVTAIVLWMVTAMKLKDACSLEEKL